MIRLSRMADYGVVVMTEIARDPGRLRTAQELAVVSHLPLPTVSKILKLLAQGGLLQSQRGTKGGYGLARSPKYISLADIVAILDGPIAMTECTTSDVSGCGIEAMCPTRGSWDKINSVVAKALSEVSLADMQAQQLGAAMADAGAGPGTGDASVRASLSAG